MIHNNVTYKNSIKTIASEIPIDKGSFLITGASGMIGSCLVDVLLEANRSFNKLFSVYAMGRNREKLLSRFGSVDKLQYVVQDIAVQIELDDIDYIIHTASNADPLSYAQCPVETITTNVLGAINVLDYCKGRKTRALLTSSFEIYGESHLTEYAENDYGVVDLNRVRSCYPVSKITAEMLFKSYYDEYDVDCVIARLPSVYGPTMQQNDSKAHAQFLRNALANQDIELKSRGEKKRTYCYVMDVVSGLLAVLFHGKSGEVYNIASDKSIASIAEIAQTIAVLAGRKIVCGDSNEIEKKGYSKPQDCILKPEKIESLGWKGKYGIESGLAETMKILQEDR